MSKLIVMNGRYNNSDCIRNLINYITTDKETSHVLTYDGFGVNNLNRQTMIDSMMKSKERADKVNGKQAYHLVISIYRIRNPMSSDRKINYGHSILYDIGYYFFERNIQSVLSLQDEIEGNWHNIHIHCVINSVDMHTGLKITNTRSLFEHLLSMLTYEYPYLKMDNYVTYE